MATKKNLTNPEEIFKESLKYIKDNDFESAYVILRKAEKDFPNEFPLINLLAQIELRKKNLSDGINLLKKSLKINAKQPLVLVDLGIALSLNNKLDEALIFFDKSIALDPTYLKAYIRKAITLKQLNRLSESIECYQKIIDLSPNDIDAYINKAELLNFEGKLEDSLYFYQQAIKIDIDNADLYITCGVLLKNLGRVDEALIAYKKVLEINPEHPKVYKHMGYIFKESKKYDQAYFCLNKAIQIHPDYELYCNLGQLCFEMGKNKEGLTYYNQANIFDSHKAEAYVLKAYAQIQEGELDQAILSFENALEVEKDYKYAFGECFHTKNIICNWNNFDHDLKFINKSIKEKKHVAVPLASCAFSGDPAIQKLAAELFVEDRFPFNNSLGPIKKYPKNKKIKIGYFSGDLSDHPVAYLVNELFEKHDKSKFKLFCFSLTKKMDSEIRTRIEKSFDEFIHVENFSDQDIANMARDKNIDIAIDLGGHTKNSRPGIFAMRAAPIQINFLGYPGTTGADYIDYNIADKFVIPNELQQHYSEKIIYLPNCYQPNESHIGPSKRIFSRKTEGLPKSAFVFCCFNNSWKITPEIFKLWIRLLSVIDGSVLWFPGFSELTIKNLRNECKKLGMNQERLIFSSKEPFREDHHAKIRLADIFLDCFPYGAQSTASDFLRAGIPVVTLKGTSFSNRVASSILNNLDLSELITSSEKDYETLAIKLAKNPEYLKKIKDKLILNVTSSPVYDIGEYAKNIESGYIQAYDRFHEGLKIKNIEAK